MSINKKLIHFDSFDVFNTYKLSANSDNTQCTIGINGDVIDETPDIPWHSIVFIKDTCQTWTHGQLYSSSVQAVDIGEQVDDVVINYITEDEVYQIVNDAIISTLNTEL